MADRFIYRGKDLTGAPGLLSGLADVNISQTPTDKQIFLFDSTSGQWMPHTITAADVQYDSNNTVADKIDGLNSNKSNLLSVQKTSYTSDISVPASKYASGTVSCARTGYTPLGVVGFAGSNNNKVSLNDVYITGTTVTFYLVNLGASVTNVKYAAYVLYVKD